jgi:hypothetical protein
MQKEETLITPSRPAVLKRPALAAALASLSLGLVASASEPSTPPPQASPAAASSTEGSSLSSLFDALSTNDPLFLVQDDVNNVDDPTTQEYDPDKIRLGVLKYPHGGFFGIDSKHSNSSLRLGAMAQFRYNLAYYEPFGGGDEEFENGAEFARLHVFAHGHLASPSLKYYIQGNYFGGSLELQDAWASWRHSDNLGFRVGQFKNPIAQESLVYSGRQLVSERSLAEAFLGDIGRVQGFSVMYSPSNRMRGEFAVHDGFGSANTGFLGSETHFGISGRMEMLMSGRWLDYKNFSAYGTEENMLAVGIGGGISWPDSNDRQSLVTADVQYENTDGVGAFAALYVSPSSFDGEEVLNVGATAQVGFMMRDDFEPFGRVSVMQLDDDVLPADFEDTYFEITGGFNWYPVEGMGRDRVRFTTDINFLPNGSPGSLSLQGYQATDEMEIVLRTQVQLTL